MSGTLFGSLTSPYVRLCRLVAHRAGAEAAVAFEIADPFDEAFRATNPLGKVPALALSGGPVLLETTLICRTLMELGGSDLLPAEKNARLVAEADLALLIGILDLGVAYRLESVRPPSEQSAEWQSRRLHGLQRALPALEDAAHRASGNPEDLVGLAVLTVCDWFDFRIQAQVPWRDACPSAVHLVEGLKRIAYVAATDPRRA